MLLIYPLDLKNPEVLSKLCIWPRPGTGWPYHALRSFPDTQMDSCFRSRNALSPRGAPQHHLHPPLPVPCRWLIAACESDDSTDSFDVRIAQHVAQQACAQQLLEHPELVSSLGSHSPLDHHASFTPMHSSPIPLPVLQARNSRKASQSGLAHTPCRAGSRTQNKSDSSRCGLCFCLKVSCHPPAPVFIWPSSIVSIHSYQPQGHQEAEEAVGVV